MVKDPCHKDFSWVWSRSEASNFREMCNASAECINISKPGVIYSREECRTITSSFYKYLTRITTTQKDLSLLTSNKKDCYDITFKSFANHLLKKHNADVRKKMNTKLEKKLRKIAKELRDIYVNDIENLNLTKISNIKLKKIAEENNLDYGLLLDEKENMKNKEVQEEMDYQRRRNFEETGFMETDEQRRNRQNLFKTIDYFTKDKRSPRK